MKSIFILLLIGLFSLNFEQSYAQNRRAAQNNNIAYQNQVKQYIRNLIENNQWAQLKADIANTDRNSYFFEALSLVMPNTTPYQSEVPSPQLKDILWSVYSKSYREGGLPFVYFLKNLLTDPSWARNFEVRQQSVKAFIESSKAGHWPENRDLLLQVYVPRTDKIFVQLTNDFLIAILAASKSPSGNGWQAFFQAYPALYKRAVAAAQAQSKLR